MKIETKRKRVFCNKRGYIEYISRNFPLFGTHRFYALFTHNGKLVGTCGFESGKDRFQDYGQMCDFLTNPRIQYDEKTGAIIEEIP